MENQTNKPDSTNQNGGGSLLWFTVKLIFVILFILYIFDFSNKPKVDPDGGMECPVCYEKYYDSQNHDSIKQYGQCVLCYRKLEWHNAIEEYDKMRKHSAN